MFNYLTPVAPKIIEVAYRWRNQTYVSVGCRSTVDRGACLATLLTPILSTPHQIKEVHSYDANSSSAYWTDAKTVMVYQVNKRESLPSGRSTGRHDDC